MSVFIALWMCLGSPRVVPRVRTPPLASSGNSVLNCLIYIYQILKGHTDTHAQNDLKKYLPKLHSLMNQLLVLILWTTAREHLHSRQIQGRDRVSRSIISAIVPRELHPASIPCDGPRATTVILLTIIIHIIKCTHFPSTKGKKPGKKEGESRGLECLIYQQESSVSEEMRLHVPTRGPPPTEHTFFFIYEKGKIFIKVLLDV